MLASLFLEGHLNSVSEHVQETDPEHDSGDER